jgi:hypothetical protein
MRRGRDQIDVVEQRAALPHEVKRVDPKPSVLSQHLLAVAVCLRAAYVAGVLGGLTDCAPGALVQPVRGVRNTAGTNLCPPACDRQPRLGAAFRLRLFRRQWSCHNYRKQAQL